MDPGYRLLLIALQLLHFCQEAPALVIQPKRPRRALIELCLQIFVSLADSAQLDVQRAGPTSADFQITAKLTEPGIEHATRRLETPCPARPLIQCTLQSLVAGLACSQLSV